MMKPLKGNKNIEMLLGSGEKVSSSFLYCVFLSNREDARYVVSVPKKNFSLAVDRNKIKRLLREIIKKNSVDLGVDGGWFMFVYSYDKILPFLDLEKDFLSLLKKLFN